MADKVVRLADRPLSKRMALARIRRLAHEGTVAWAPGVEERALDLGLTNDDLRNVIRHGRVVGSRKVARDWRYELRGRSVEGDDLAYELELLGLLMVVRLTFDSRGRLTTE